MIVHLNGELVGAEKASISPLDRGFLFGDGVYEGLRAFMGRVVAMDRHVARLARGLEATGIRFDAALMPRIAASLLEANGLCDAFIYVQVTRGTPGPGQPPRDRVPGPEIRPTVFAFCTPQPDLESYRSVPTRSARILPDQRWLLGRIKSTSLLGNVLASLEADRLGAQDAVLVRDGLVAEATGSNVLLALPEPGGRAQIVTPALENPPILDGVTRTMLIESIPEIVERPVRVEELAAASEVMLAGSITMLSAVTGLDGRPVGDGQPGPIASRLLHTLVRTIESEHE